MSGGVSVANVPIRQPEFDWNSINLSQEFSTFKRICTSLLDDGPYSELSGKQKVATVLNWLGKAAYQLHKKFPIMQVLTKINCLMFWIGLRLISDHSIT